MTQDQFYTWLKDPSTMDSVSIAQIREVLKRYPYFQSAQAMLAKNLKQENHIDQLDQLQLAAVHAPDRKVFHDYLFDKTKRTVLAEEEPLQVEDEVPIIELPETIVDSPPEQEKITHLFPDELIPEPIIYQLETADLPELPPKEPEVQEPGELSFSQWLDFTESQKVNTDKRSITATESADTQANRTGIELIDHFLTQQTNAPKKRAEFFNPQKVAARGNQDDFTVVSETLAKIYVQQEKYELARQAYEALSLKYPEKSVYFAARLKEIDDLLNSAN